MDMIVDEFGATTLPLSISYRCAKNIVQEANEYMPDEAFENSPWGSVETLKGYEPETFSSEDVFYVVIPLH